MSESSPSSSDPEMTTGLNEAKPDKTLLRLAHLGGPFVKDEDIQIINWLANRELWRRKSPPLTPESEEWDCGCKSACCCEKPDSAPESVSVSEPRWVHATNPEKFPVGSVMGWASKESPTGYLSGVVVQRDSTAMRVFVKDIAPGVFHDAD